MLSIVNYLAWSFLGNGGNAGADGTSATASGGNPFSFIILMVVLFGGMYFLTIRPQKKQQKKDQEMRENTQIGDEITTIGGIMGRVVTVKDDSIVIETGADRNKMKLARWAIQTNNTAVEKVQAEREAARAAQEKAAAEKKDKKSKKEDK
ncbi:MAG: preprotein translocase subunit YajC [Clostridiaceae bacterium]|nr:preprotein translocase subunit YajC [Clostridiaceae bacterium]